MLPFLPFHALASQRGDGLRPELLALLLRSGTPQAGLAASIEPERAEYAARPVSSDIPDACLNLGDSR